MNLKTLLKTASFSLLLITASAFAIDFESGIDDVADVISGWMIFIVVLIAGISALNFWIDHKIKQMTGKESKMGKFRMIIMLAIAALMIAGQWVTIPAGVYTIFAAVIVSMLLWTFIHLAVMWGTKQSGSPDRWIRREAAETVGGSAGRRLKGELEDEDEEEKVEKEEEETIVEILRLLNKAETGPAIRHSVQAALEGAGVTGLDEHHAVELVKCLKELYRDAKKETAAMHTMNKMKAIVALIEETESEAEANVTPTLSDHGMTMKNAARDLGENIKAEQGTEVKEMKKEEITVQKILQVVNLLANSAKERAEAAEKDEKKEAKTYAKEMKKLEGLLVKLESELREKVKLGTKIKSFFTRKGAGSKKKREKLYKKAGDAVDTGTTVPAKA